MANDLRLTIVAGVGAGRELTVPEAGAVLGRDKQADIVLGEKALSRRHCRIFRQEGRWLLEDLGSRNGTFVNGKRATRAELKGGDVIQLGQTRLTVVALAVTADRAGPQPSAAAAPPPPPPPPLPQGPHHEMKCRTCGHTLEPKKRLCASCKTVGSPWFSRALPWVLGACAVCALGGGILGGTASKELPQALAVMIPMSALAVGIAIGLFFGSTVAWHLWTFLLGLAVFGGMAAFISINAGLPAGVFVLSSLAYIGVAWRTASPERWKILSVVDGVVNAPAALLALAGPTRLWAAIGVTALSFVVVSLIVWTYSVRVRWWYRVRLGWSGAFVGEEQPAAPWPRRGLALIVGVGAAVVAAELVAYTLMALRPHEGRTSGSFAQGRQPARVLAAMPAASTRVPMAPAPPTPPSSGKMPTAKKGEEPVELPEKYKAEAEEAFAKGFTYFIWPAEPGPFRRGDSQILVVPIFYFAKGKPIPFQETVGVIAKPEGAGEPYVKWQVLKGNNPPAVRPSGRAGAIYLDFFKALSGKGKAAIRLVDYETTQKQISNEITVDVEF